MAQDLETQMADSLMWQALKVRLMRSIESEPDIVHRQRLTAFMKDAWPQMAPRQQEIIDLQARVRGLERLCRFLSHE